MATKLTQAKVDKTRHDHEPGSQIYDADVSGLRIVVGKKSASYKLMGRINDGTDRYVSIVIGRIDELSLKSARERAKELRMILRRGDDPRAPKDAIPNLSEVFERYMNTRGKELSPRTANWYRQKVEGSLSSLKKLSIGAVAIPANPPMPGQHSSNMAQPFFIQNRPSRPILQRGADMTVTVNPDLMDPLADAGYTLISLHHWDAKAKCPRTGKLRIRGKSPIHRDWTKRPYRNADAMKHAAKGGNVGVRLTTRDVVVDVDPRNLDGGRKAMLPALKGLGLDPDYFPTVLTGGGGLHLYMVKPARLSIVDGLRDVSGIEFKTFGRQVVAPGSVHPSGKPYVWSSVPDDLWLGAPRAPEKLLRLIRRPKRPIIRSGQGIGEHPPEEIAIILGKLDPEDFRDHDRWLQLMMACHHASAGAAQQEFVEWCTADPLYSSDGPEIAYRWDSLNRHGVGLGTLYMFMRDAGAAHLIDRRPRFDFPDDLANLEVAQCEPPLV